MLFPQLLPFANVGLWILRFAVGIIFFYHSLPKLRNSSGMAEMMGMGGMGMMVMLLGLVEFLSGIALVLGVWTQLAALVIGIIMLGAVGMKTMKWNVPFAAMDKTGWEFDLVLLASAIAILFTGGGAIGILR